MTKTIKTALASAIALAAFAVPSFAADVEFSGTIEDGANTCTLSNAVAGTLSANDDFTVLETASLADEGGITATATSPNFRITVAPPTDWDAKGTAYTETTTFQTKFDLDNDTDATGAPKGYLSSSQKLKSGDTDVKIQLKATANNAATFTPGTYTATVVVTCEAE